MSLSRELQGKLISHYRITHELGRGGMGVVYKAEDTRLKRSVALKFLSSLTVYNAEEKIRFLREAQAAAALNHPNICTIYEIDEFESPQGGRQPLIAMEYVEGKSLKEKIEDERLKINEIAEIALQAAEGLQAAHEQGIIHRDMKSDNVMVTEKGIVKIMDFGLAKPSGGTQLTREGTTLGTISYMSPEQARGEKVDYRTDIWSFGVMLYEMVAGQLPFRGEYDQAVIYSILHEPHPPIDNPDLPQPLAEIIDRTLEKDPEDRFQNIGEVIEALTSLAGGEPSSLPISHRKNPATSRTRLFLVFALTAFILLSVFAIIRFTSPPAAKSVNSIAVLPLDNLTGDSQQDFFCDGMTEALISELAQAGDFERVISRTSVMAYKNVQKPLPQIARELGVETVIEGSVSRYGNRVKITAQLIQATEDRHLWAQHFESDMQDVLQLHSDIARAIVREIKQKISPAESLHFTGRRKVNPDAYQYVLQGRYQMNKMNDEGMLKAIEFLGKAIALDSTYAPAYAALSDVYWKRTLGYAPMPVGEAKQNAEKYARKAVAMDDNNPQAHTVLGQLYFTNWNWEDAGEELKRAIALNPSSAIAHQNYSSYLMLQRKFAKSIAEIKKARDLDPLSIFIRTQVGWPYWYSGRYAEALQIWTDVVDLEPNFALAHYNRGLGYIMLNQPDSAIAAYQKALALAPGNIIFESLLWHARALSGDTSDAKAFKQSLVNRWEKARDFSPYYIAFVSAGLHQTDEVFKWLETAVQEQDVFVTTLPIEQFFKEYWSDPRFNRLVRQIGLQEVDL